MLLAASLLGCTGRVERAGDAWLNRSQQDPALSGDGRLLAMISELRGRPTVLLRNENGSIQPVPQLRRHQPHSSPSLSWNGRYLAVIIQRGNRRLVLIEDRLNGRAHPLRLPSGRNPIRLSLAPDGRQLAVQTADQGRWQVELIDLTGLLEPDRRGGLRRSNPAEPQP